MNEKSIKPIWLDSVDTVIARVQYNKKVMEILDKAELMSDCSYYYYSGVSLNRVKNYEEFLDVLKRIKRAGLSVEVSGYTNSGSEVLVVSLDVSLVKGDHFCTRLDISVDDLEESLKRISKGKCHVRKETVMPVEFKPYESTCITCDARP